MTPIWITSKLAAFLSVGVSLHSPTNRPVDGPSASPRRTDMSTVTFYKANERPFGVFSNLYRCEMWFEGRLFLSSEHAYQFGKPRDDRVREG